VTSKNRKIGRKNLGKTPKKARRPGKKAKAQRSSTTRTHGPKIPPTAQPTIAETTIASKEPAREGARFEISIDRIEGETVIGDMIVVFPRTRNVLQKHGLRLDVEHAGDIYMTLDAFAALQGVKTENLIQELTEVSKQPPPAQPMPQLVTPPTT